jgi:hypothetical protein
MKAAAAMLIGWLVPGGGYLMARRYKQFALFLALICAAVGAGVALHGGNLWPRAEDVQGLDGLTVFIARAGAVAKGLAGGPYLIAAMLGDVSTYTQGRIHEYGTTLLTMAGILNVMAIVDGRR